MSVNSSSKPATSVPFDHLSYDRGKAVAQRVTGRLADKYTEWQGGFKVWTDYGARDACYMLYTRFPQIQRLA